MRRAIVVGLTVATVAAGVTGVGAGADSSVVGTVPMGSNTLLSAAVYNASGQLVRHLYNLAPRAGTADIHWDGTDDTGAVLPAGSYTWRAATSSVTGADEGGVGVGGVPQPGEAFDTVREPGSATS